MHGNHRHWLQIYSPMQLVSIMLVMATGQHLHTITGHNFKYGYSSQKGSKQTKVLPKWNLDERLERRVFYLSRRFKANKTVRL